MLRKNSVTPGRKHVFQTVFLTVIFLLFLLALYFIILNVNKRQGENLMLDQTQALDLSTWEFDKEGKNYLESGWQFYPDQLLIPDDFLETSLTSDKNLPRYDASTLLHFSNASITNEGWTDLGSLAVSNSPSLKASDINNYGYGTYRIVIEVSRTENNLAVDFPEINQAAQIWVNGTLLKSTGEISVYKEGYSAQEVSVNVKAAPSAAGLIEIVINCANYASPYGGIACIPAIGTVAQIDNLNLVSKMWITSVFTLLIMIIITGFYVSFTFTNKKKYYYFILIISMSLAYELFDKSLILLPGNWNRLLQATFFLLMTLVATLYFSSLFEKEQDSIFDRVNNWDVLIIFSLISIFLIIFWLRPDYLYDMKTIILSSIFVAVVNVYNLIKIFYTTIRHAEYGVFHLISAITALVVFSTIPLRSQQIYFIPLHSIGIVLMIFSAAIYFTIRYVGNYNKVSRFTLELERAVQEKTKNIATVNDELLRANQKLQENEEARKKMMSNMSHDLRTPITAIRGYTELLLNSGSKVSEETQEAYLRNMHLRSVQMEQMIDDLVELTRLEYGSIILNTQALSMNHVLENLYGLYLTECRSTGKTITLELPENDPLNVIGDASHLIRVLDNLIINAMRYTYEQGHIDIKASREAAPESGEIVHIIIKDDGCGIPASEIDYVFDRFYRASNSAAIKTGSGLGLSIVKSIIEKHGGHVWVESAQKQGSIFHITLPATKKL